MNDIILSRNYELQQVNVRETLRYAGCRSAEEDVSALLRECIAETDGRLAGRVCWRVLPVSVAGDMCNFDILRCASVDLAVNLRGCSRVILFAATVGVEIDRLIARYSRISPAKALMMQALGAERIESLCDIFCADAAGEYQTETRPRFSPGYGDLPISVQKDIFTVLDCTRRIGVSLNDSLLMSPSKSVTAFVGLIDR